MGFEKNQFVQYLHHQNVPSIIDDLLAHLNEDKPEDPLRGIHQASKGKVMSKTLALGKDSPPIDDPLGDITHRSIADSLVNLHCDTKLLEELEHRSTDLSPGFCLDIKLALSKMLIASLPPFHLTVVIPVLNEASTILPKSKHDQGGDAIRRKWAQLDWLLSGRKDCTWEVLVVDDGSEDNTVEAAQGVIDMEGYRMVRVLRLAEGISEKCAMLQDMGSTSDSMKGGSVVYGIAQAIQGKHEGKEHVIVTSPGLGTDLAQCGRCVHQVLRGGYHCSLGVSYGTPGAVSFALRNGMGQLTHGMPRERSVVLSLLLAFRDRILPPLAGVMDTECLKAMHATSVTQVLHLVRSYKQAFATDLLLQLAMRFEGDKVFSVVPAVHVALDALGEMQSANEDESRRRSMTDWHNRLADMLELYDLKRATLSDWVGVQPDWVDFARTLTVQHFTQLVTALLTALADKEELALPEPTVLNLRITDAQAVVQGTSMMNRKIVVYK